MSDIPFYARTLDLGHRTVTALTSWLNPTDDRNEVEKTEHRDSALDTVDFVRSVRQMHPEATEQDMSAALLGRCHRERPPPALDEFANAGRWSD